MDKKIMIIAGEASGDIHGAGLARAIRELSPGVRLSGLGGGEMSAAGVELYQPLVDIAVIGFVEVLKHFRRFRKIFYHLVEKLDSDRPDLVVLIDYPGFNLRFARQAKKRGIPVVYYISPQVWAWGKRRIALIRQIVDRMLCIFKFEEELYRQNGVPVSFVGHPLLDHINQHLSRSKEEILTEFGFKDKEQIIAILPGSRENEIRRHLPLMLKAAALIKKEIPRTRFIILKPRDISEQAFTSLIEKNTVPMTIIENRMHDGLKISDLALVCSGTATLETALSETPMIIIYRVSFLTWLALKPLIQIPDIGLANIVAGKRIVPELVQYDARPENIAAEALKILKSPGEKERIAGELKEVRAKLGMPGAGTRAARIILETL